MLPNCVYATTHHMRWPLTTAAYSQLDLGDIPYLYFPLRESHVHSYVRRRCCSNELYLTFQKVFLIVLAYEGLLYSSWSSHGKYTGVVCHSFLQGSRFVRTTMTHPSWVTLNGMAHSFTELHKLLHHDKAVIPEGLYRQGCDLPRVMYSCESWTVKKAECQRIDVFELWCWRRLLKVPWTGKRTNQSISRESTLTIHWKDWCWSCGSSILVIWCKQTTNWKSPWFGESLRAEGEEGIRRWDGWMVSLIQWTWTWANFGRWWGTGRPGVLQSMGSQRVGHDLVTEQQQKWRLLFS